MTDDIDLNIDDILGANIFGEEEPSFESDPEDIREGVESNRTPTTEPDVEDDFIDSEGAKEIISEDEPDAVNEDYTESSEEIAELSEEPTKEESIVPFKAKAEPKAEPLNKEEDTAEKLAGRLELWTKSCRDLFVDLRMFTFFADDEDMFLTSQDEEYFDKRLYFKTDPDNPRDPKILHAQKQFCKFIKVPHAFFMNNRPSLRNDVVKTWQAGLDTDDSKARCIARIRESQDYCVIRAMVPESHNLLRNHELIKLLDDYSKESTIPYHLEFATGDNRDDLILHARFLFDSTFEISGFKCCLGFSVLASELGKGPLVIDTLVHHLESKTSFVASYGSESYFWSKYEGIQGNEIKDMLPNMINRLTLEADEMKKRIEQSPKSVVPHEECIKINTWSGVPKKFKRALFHEASTNEDNMNTSFDFAKHMSLIAKDFDALKRLEVERASGRYLNLYFGRD